MLLSIAFDIIPSSLTVDSIETAVYVGTTTGPIRSFDLTSPPRTRECYVSDKESGVKFIGHTKAVTALSVSLFGDNLVSGSTDCTVRLWHIASRQCLRSIQLKEPVINMFLTLIPRQLTANDLDPSIVLKSFKKTEEQEDDHFVEVYCYNDLFEEENYNFGHEDDTSVREELEKTKAVNARIYEFAINSILNNDNEPDQKEVHIINIFIIYLISKINPINIPTFINFQAIDINSFSVVDLESYGEKNGHDINFDDDDEESIIYTDEYSTTQKKKKRRRRSKKNVNDTNMGNILKYS